MMSSNSKKILELKEDMIAHVFIRKGNDTWEIPLCIVYGNKKNEKDITMMIQDQNNPENQIQITFEKQKK